MTDFRPRVFFGAGLLQVAAFGVYLAMAAYVIPFWDTLDWIATRHDLDSLAAWLWHQHADVRQPVVKLLLWLDLRLFAGLFYPIAAVCAAAMLACMVWIARLASASMVAPLGKGVAFGLPLILGFQSFTLPAYMESSLVQHVLVPIFLIAAIAPIVRSPPETVPGPASLALGALGAIAASLTFPNGLLAWPILAWLVWRRGGRTIRPALFLIAGAATAAVYFAGLDFGTAARDGHAPATPLSIAWFLLAFFSVPWIRVPELMPIGLCIGAAILAVAADMAVRVGIRGRAHDPVREVALALVTFAVGTALMIAVARAGFLDLRAQGTRYGVYAAMAQLAVALYALPVIDRLDRRVLAGGALLVLAGLATQQIVIGEKAATAGRDMAAIRDALRNDAETPALLAKLYPDPARAADHVALLKRDGLYGLGGPD